MKEKVFLETTIQINRLADDLPIKQAITAELVDKEVFTSSFVLREFLNTIIRDIIYVHGCVLALEDENGRLALQRLAIFLATSPGQFSARSARRVHLVVGELLARMNKTSLPRKQLLTRLERISQQWLRDFFEVVFPDGQVATVNCLSTLDDKDNEIYELIRGVPFPATPAFPQCVSEFLQERKEDVHKVVEVMIPVRSKLHIEQLLKVLERMKDKSTGDYDFRNKLKPRTRGNWHLGDLLISLETPAWIGIYTTDRLYQIICPVLKKTVYSGYLPYRRIISRS